jgi:hypothetical protein
VIAQSIQALARKVHKDAGLPHDIELFGEIAQPGDFTFPARVVFADCVEAVSCSLRKSGSTSIAYSAASRPAHTGKI